MTTAEQIKIRDAWRKLNITINNAVRVMGINEKAGQVFDMEYKEWLSALMKERDELTKLVA